MRDGTSVAFQRTRGAAKLIFWAPNRLKFVQQGATSGSRHMERSKLVLRTTQMAEVERT